MHIYRDTEIPRYIYTYLHLHIRTYVHMYIYTYRHIDIYTYIHIYIYTCIHIYTYSPNSVYTGGVLADCLSNPEVGVLACSCFRPPRFVYAKRPFFPKTLVSSTRNVVAHFSFHFSAGPVSAPLSAPSKEFHFLTPKCAQNVVKHSIWLLLRKMFVSLRFWDPE